MHYIGNFGNSCEFGRLSLEKPTEIHHNSGVSAVCANYDGSLWVFKEIRPNSNEFPKCPIQCTRSAKKVSKLREFSALSVSVIPRKSQRNAPIEPPKSRFGKPSFGHSARLTKVLFWDGVEPGESTQRCEEVVIPPL